jgi:hypothetical protein
MNGLDLCKLLFKSLEPSLFFFHLLLFKGHGNLVLICKLSFSFEHLVLLPTELRVSLLETTFHKLSEVNSPLLDSLQRFFKLLLLLKLLFKDLGLSVKLALLLVKQVLILSLLRLEFGLVVNLHL